MGFGGVGKNIKKSFITEHCHKVNVHIRGAYHLLNLQIQFIILYDTVILLCVE